MSFRFKPEDFTHEWTNQLGRAEYADRANQLLDAHVATPPEVFRGQIGGGAWREKNHYDSDTHRARLWGVEEIKQKKCEHVLSAQKFFDQISDESYKKDRYFRVDTKSNLFVSCRDCGKRLVAEWREE